MTMKSGYILLKVSVIAPILCTYDPKKRGKQNSWKVSKDGTSAIHAKCGMPDSGECNFLPLQELLSGITCTCSQLHTRYVTWALQKEECQWDYAGEGHHKTNRNACIEQEKFPGCQKLTCSRTVSFWESMPLCEPVIVPIFCRKKIHIEVTWRCPLLSSDLFFKSMR